VRWFVVCGLHLASFLLYQCVGVSSSILLFEASLTPASLRHTVILSAPKGVLAALEDASPCQFVSLPVRACSISDLLTVATRYCWFGIIIAAPEEAPSVREQSSVLRDDSRQQSSVFRDDSRQSDTPWPCLVHLHCSVSCNRIATEYRQHSTLSCETAAETTAEFPLHIALSGTAELQTNIGSAPLFPLHTALTSATGLQPNIDSTPLCLARLHTALAPVVDGITIIVIDNCRLIQEDTHFGAVMDVYLEVFAAFKGRGRAPAVESVGQTGITVLCDADTSTYWPH
jgi:hypothetical protein